VSPNRAGILGYGLCRGSLRLRQILRVRTEELAYWHDVAPSS